MIPAAFDYVGARSVDEALAALAQHGDEAKVLAGGHSLLPLMKLRLAMPGVLVDVSRVEELRGIREEDGWLVVGASTTQQEVVDSELVRSRCGALAAVSRTVGDPQVRHRGTVGGAVAHGDAAGDLPTLVLALRGEVVVQGPAGRRVVPAEEFFVDYLETALAPDELLVEVRLPVLGDGWSWDYQKFSRVAQAWAIVGALAVVRRDNGSITEARVGLTHMGATPIRAAGVEEALVGVPASADVLQAAAARADDGTSPPADLNAQPDYRRHLARVLTRRALERAAGV
jgi:aerobic carbon-monoxide dehydrogenase medium subunit